jgi:DNA-binding response OmpR family regulator
VILDVMLPDATGYRSRGIRRRPHLVLMVTEATRSTTGWPVLTAAPTTTWSSRSPSPSCWLRIRALLRRAAVFKGSLQVADLSWTVTRVARRAG